MYPVVPVREDAGGRYRPRLHQYQSYTWRISLTSLSLAESSSRMLDAAITGLIGRCVLAGVGIRCRSLADISTALNVYRYTYRSLNVNIGQEFKVNNAYADISSDPQLIVTRLTESYSPRSIYTSVSFAHVTNSLGAQLTACFASLSAHSVRPLLLRKST